jgi:hypothetical protein
MHPGVGETTMASSYDKAALAADDVRSAPEDIRLLPEVTTDWLAAQLKSYVRAVRFVAVVRVAVIVLVGALAVSPRLLLLGDSGLSIALRTGVFLYVLLEYATASIAARQAKEAIARIKNWRLE